MSSKQKINAKKDGGGGFFFSTLSFIAICAALVFGMSVFFRVSNIEVTGAKRYTESEIISASGIKNGDNLMFVNRASVAERIYSKLLYLGNVKVSRKLPNTIVIEVEESNTFAVVETDSGLWLIDKNCRLIEKCSPQEAETHIRISGVAGVKPQKGEILSAGEADKPKIQYLKEIMSAIDSYGMAGDISTVDVSNAANAEFLYLGRFKIKLGGRENIEYKLEMLENVVSKLEPEEKGTIDLSKSKTAQFSPE